VAVVPAFVTALGLLFAVLTERVRWSVAFKTVVFLPMAISAFATGVTWRIMYQQDPDVGAINALGRSAHAVFSPAGVLPSALPSTGNLIQHGSGGAITLKKPLHPGLPGVTVDLQQNGKTVAKTTTGDDGSFDFGGLSPGTYQAEVGSATFAKPFGGYAWLGPSLITPALLIAYIWIWAGFAMVVIAAGLSAMPRDVLEAARTDGATEWQTFKRVTVPLLAPVLSVVFVTMIINVLKVFDIVLALAPESTQANANVIALAMWRTAFGGVNDFGTGSAIAVFLFVLVIPVLALNIQRFKREV
jgi:alpha-glucoside transport system permease protein